MKKISMQKEEIVKMGSQDSNTNLLIADKGWILIEETFKNIEKR